MTKIERTCPRCGLVFFSEHLDDLCPGCLITHSLDDVEPTTSSAFWEDEPNEDAPPATRSFSHFEILEEIGRGGMGVVYRARDHSTARIVALKVLQAHHLEVPDLVQRFRSEVRAVTSLDHPHVLPIHEVGEHDGIPFFSMKLTTGGSLAQRLGDFLSKPKEAAQLLAKIARGVQHAHERGILHRDLKPGNILIDAAGEPYVADFGLAKWLEEDRHLTVTAAVLGTPHYIAPEQASGTKALTTAVDIYSLGAILYELLTGRPPFVGGTVIETLRQASEKTPDRPSSLVHNVPHDLETICLKCIEREPASRYASAALLADDLEAWLTGRAIHARPINAAGQLWRWAKRNPLPAMLVASLVITLVFIAVGSTSAAIKIGKERTRALAAEKDAKEKLYQSLLAQARASLVTGRAGQRFDTLEALQQAAQIHPSLEVRNEAIAALALLDLKIEKTWTVRTRGQVPPAFDEKLETVASEGQPGKVRITRISDQKVLSEFGDSNSTIEFITRSNREFIAVRYGGGIVSVWNTNSRKKCFELTERPRADALAWLAFDCAFSPDAASICVSIPSGGVSIHDSSTGIEVSRIPESEQPNCVAYSPSGQQLALSLPKESALIIWDVIQNRQSARFELSAPAKNFSWSKDGRQLAIGSTDFNIYVLDSTSGEKVAAFIGHRQEVTQVIFNHSGDLLASTSRDKTIRIWSLRSLSQEVLFSGLGGEPSLRFGEDDQHLSATAFDTQAYLLRIGGIDRICQTFVPGETPGRATLVGSLDFAPDGRTLASASYEGIDIWDSERGKHLAFLPIAVNDEKSVRFGENSESLVVASNSLGLHEYQLLRTEDRITIVKDTTLDADKGFIFSIASLNDRRYYCLTSREKGEAKIFDLQSRTFIFKIANQIKAWDMTVSPDLSTCVLSYYSDNARVWSVAKNKLIAELNTGAAGVARYSSDGHYLITTGYNGTIVWNPANWSQVRWYSDIGKIAIFSPRQQFAAVSDNEDITILETKGFSKIALLNPPLFPSFSHRLCFSLDERKLAAQGTDNSLRIWNIGKIRGALEAINMNW